MRVIEALAPPTPMSLPFQTSPPDSRFIFPHQLPGGSRYLAMPAPDQPFLQSGAGLRFFCPLLFFLTNRKKASHLTDTLWHSSDAPLDRFISLPVIVIVDIVFLRVRSPLVVNIVAVFARVKPIPSGARWSFPSSWLPYQLLSGGSR